MGPEGVIEGSRGVIPKLGSKASICCRIGYRQGNFRSTGQTAGLVQILGTSKGSDFGLEAFVPSCWILSGMTVSRAALSFYAYIWSRFQLNRRFDREIRLFAGASLRLRSQLGPRLGVGMRPLI